MHKQLWKYFYLQRTDMFVNVITGALHWWDGIQEKQNIRYSEEIELNNWYRRRVLQGFLNTVQPPPPPKAWCLGWCSWDVTHHSSSFKHSKTLFWSHLTTWGGHDILPHTFCTKYSVLFLHCIKYLLSAIKYRSMNSKFYNVIRYMYGCWKLQTSLFFVSERTCKIPNASWPHCVLKKTML